GPVGPGAAALEGVAADVRADRRLPGAVAARPAGRRGRAAECDQPPGVAVRLRAGDEFRDPAPPQAKASARDRPCYRVSGVVREDARGGLYEGKKLFTNFH